MPTFTNNGHRLFYREQGTGNLLLILPGNTATSACHLGELEYFGRRWHAVSLDFWGTGQSERLDAWPVDWWRQGAHDAAALIAHLQKSSGQPSAYVMGTSGGAIVALWLAILYPERVRGVIADSTLEFFDGDRLRQEVANRRRLEPGATNFWRNAQGEDWQQVVEADNALLLAWAGRPGSMFDGRLGEIHCPVLFTTSLEDEAQPGIADQVGSMCAQIPDSQAHLVNGGSHPLMWSRPETFRRVAETFLSEHPILVSPPNPNWPLQAEVELARLRQALGDILLEAHHVGSTSVPGLYAKPIFDFLLVVSSLEAVDALNPQLSALGYVARGENGIAGRRFFYKDTGEQRTQHLHFYAPGHVEIRKTLAFRDYLRTHPDEAQAYGQHKLELAQRFQDDRSGYVAAKAPFIQEMLERALTWWNQRETPSIPSAF